MPKRPKAIIEIKAGAKSEAGMSCIKDHFQSTSRIIATTPNAPTRLSFMISSIRCGDRPDSTPSAVSIRPSQCKPPVMKIHNETNRLLRTVAGSQPPVASAARARIAPATTPTNGKKATLRPNDCSSQAGSRTRRIRVKNCNAVMNSFNMAATAHFPKIKPPTSVGGRNTPIW